jgi:O-antigen ligase
VKWVFLIVVAALVWPLSVRLRRNSRDRLRIFVLAGFLPFVLSAGHLYLAVISWDWVGYVKGAEISVLDLIALAIYLSLPGPKGGLPFRWSMSLYFAVTSLSAIQAMYPMAALFYSLQLARAFLVYVTVYRGVCADPRIAASVLKGMAAGMFLEAAVAAWQHFGLGVVQTPGTFSSQNLLGVVSQFAIFPFFAIVLGGRRGWLPPAVVAAGLAIAVLTTSRGTMALDAVGLAIVFVLSAFRQWTSRKAKVLLMGVGAMAVFAPLAALSLQQRFNGGQEIGLVEEDRERLIFKEAAAAMLSDHPMGVGPNHFTIIANLGGYFARAGEFWSNGLATNVHNVYWLVATETGYLGLITFVLFLLRPLTVAFACSFRHRRDVRGDLLLGLGTALLVVYIHSFEEWILVTFDAQYVCAIVIGLIAGLARELGYWRPR